MCRFHRPRRSRRLALPLRPSPPQVNTLLIPPAFRNEVRRCPAEGARAARDFRRKNPILILRLGRRKKPALRQPHQWRRLRPASYEYDGFMEVISAASAIGRLRRVSPSQPFEHLRGGRACSFVSERHVSRSWPREEIDHFHRSERWETYCVFCLILIIKDGTVYNLTFCQKLNSYHLK